MRGLDDLSCAPLEENDLGQSVIHAEASVSALGQELT